MSYLIKVKPLGGVGQIGGNMTLVETANSGFIIDAGILFPREKAYGIRFLYPNFYDHLSEKFQSIIITHSHEDHIGAVKKILKFRPELKIYCSRFCYELLKSKCDINFENVTLIKGSEAFEVSGCKITPIEIDHSTPQTFAFYIEKEQAGIFFSSDFKFNSSSQKALKTLKSLKPSFRSKKVFCSFLDSTSIKNKNFTHSEGQLQDDLLTALDSPKRITATLFASNIHRLSSIIKHAESLNKKVYLFGRSIHFYYKAAIASGDMKKSSHVHDIDAYNGKSKDCIIIVSGCQGDFRSTLTNLSKNQSQYYHIGSEDLIVFSSSIIPGNERQIQTLYNRFIELGADILTSKDLDIHCSGHPGQEDIRLLTSHLPITHHFPIHGETFLLKEHYYFAKNELKLNSHFIRDFDEITIRNYKVSITNHPYEQDDIQPILVAENNRDISKDVIKNRRKLAEAGFIIVDTHSSKIQEYATGLNKNDIHKLEQRIFSYLGKYSPSSEELKVFAKSQSRKITKNKLPVFIV